MTELIWHGGTSYRIAKGEKNEEVQEFMRKHALHHYQCAPPPSLGVVIGAWREEEIVGSIALDFRESNEPFPLEDLYDKEAFGVLFPTGFDRTSVVQAGRWFSTLPGSSVSHDLLQATKIYARALGRIYLLGEGKPYALKRFGELGYKCVSAPNHKPKVELVPSEGRRYYDLLPLPQLFRLDL